MAALWQRGRSQTPRSAGGFKSPPMQLASQSLDSDTDSDESDMELPPRLDSPAMVPAQHTALAATAASAKSEPSKAAGSPSQSGLLWRLGALRRSVSPVKKGAVGAVGTSKSPQKILPVSSSTSDASGASTAAAAPKEPRQQATSKPHGSRSQTFSGAAEAGERLSATQPSGGAVGMAPSSSMPKGARDRRNLARRSTGHQDLDAARHPESGGHKATAAAAVAAASIARSGSDASSLITDTTAASGVSSGLGNARTAADSYGGSVFASALNQEAGLQLLSQVSEIRARLAKVAGMPPGHGGISPAEMERRQRAQQAMIALNQQKQALQEQLRKIHVAMGLPIPPSLVGTPASSKAPSPAGSSRSSVQGHGRASAAGPSNPVPRPGSPTGSTTSSSNWSSVLSLSGMSGSTGSGLAGVSGGGMALDGMEAAALGRHLAALREKLDDVCDEIVLVKELIKVGVMHTTSPTRAQRQDGTVPSVLGLMHQTQLQQERRDRLMRRKERLLGQIAEVEARLGIGVAPALSAAGSDGAPPGRATSPRRQLPPLSPLSPPVPRGGKPAVNEVEMLQQVEAQLSAVRSLLLTASPGGVEVASAAHQAVADLLNSVPRGQHALPTSPEAFDAASSPLQQQPHRAARRSLDYSSQQQQQQQQRSPYGGCRAPSPLGLPQLGLPQIPGSPGPSSARQSGAQTPRHHSAQQAAANLGQLAAMKAEVAKAMAAMVQ